MKKCLLASVVALAIGCPARAALNCGPATIDLGDSSGGVVSTYVAYDPGKWVIRHTLANGMLVDRGTQYAITDYTSPTTMQWRGALDRNPRMTMVGEVMHLKTTGQPTYNEWLYKDGQLIMHSVAICQFDKPPVIRPSVSAPATIAPAYAPIAAPAPAATSYAPVAATAPVVASALTVAPAIVAPPAPPAAPAPVAAAPVGEDSIGILNLGNAVFAQLVIGSKQVMMQVDTGATEMTVSDNVAQALLAKGEAETTDDEQAILADGSKITSKRVIIHEVKIGMHVLRNVDAAIVPNDAGMLLPFPVLNAIGIVTIDTAANKLIFNQPPKIIGAVAETPPAAAALPPAADVQAMPVATAPPAAAAERPAVAEPFAVTPAPQVDPTPGKLY
jgi:gag-polyprotein putative aspartyl protease